MTYDFTFSIKPVHITFKSAIKHRHRVMACPQGQTCPPSRGNHSRYTFKCITYEHLHKSNKYKVDAN